MSRLRLRGALASLHHTWCVGGLYLYFNHICSSPHLSHSQIFQVVFLIPYFVLYALVLVLYNVLIPVAAWSKARVCGRSLAGNAGSKPVRVLGVSLV
jgi:hypothetical protein